MQVISDHPFIGLGIAGGEQALNLTHGRHHTAHNVFLDVAMWGGLLGLSIYLFFFYSIFRLALNYRNYTNDPAGLVLVIFFMVLLFKSGGGFTSKYVWYFLPCATVLPYRYGSNEKGLAGTNS